MSRGTGAGELVQDEDGDVLGTNDDTRARVVDERYVGTYRRHVNNLT